ncbi:telomere-associated protein Tap [Streptomyces violascens]|uniref:telomere-associated protein Tap n=1 Tax=Streptomyces violascens TaxID=67381 RepID=UPI00167BE8B9|nr:transcriptional regulator [Streptomyces violascens]GGU51155.1 transcriptional regulator [Streptomyces violascens]
MADTSYTAPLVVLDASDGVLVAHRPDVQRVSLPEEVIDLATAADWAVSYGLGAAALSRFGEDAAALLVLTESATVFLGLPDRLDDRVRLRVADDHPAVKAVSESGWSLSRAGLSPWSWMFRNRAEVVVAVVPWGAFDARITRWGGMGDIADPSALAYALGVYAERVTTPTSSTAGTSLALMTALRPPTRATFERGTGRMKRVPVEGSLVEPVDPAPPEAPTEHPLAAERTREQTQDPAHVLFEEALVWHRTELTAEEAALPYVVGLDINMAFLAAANRLTVGLGPAVYTDGPRFDKRVPGSWLVDLSGAVLRTKDPRTKALIELDPRLPSPFTPHGHAPTGPAWYATPTLAYAAELGVEVRPLAGWLRPESGGYLDLWHDRLRDAYMATLADLGVTADMPEDEFVRVMPTLKERDPEAYAVLTAIKHTAKGGVGKLREKPMGKRPSRHAPWPALKRATWRPDIRAAVISNARVGQHRKIVKTWALTGQVPLAVLSDCVVYPSAYPTARAVVPRKEDGMPMPGAFRLGPNPGYCKEEGVQTMEWLAELIARQANPARFIKGGDAIRDGE